MLGDGQRPEADPPAGARRLVHLAEHQRGMVEYARAAHVVQQFMAFAPAFADPGEHRNAVVVFHHGVDRLHHQHGLADAGAAEHRRLAALGERHQQVDHLDPGLEDRRRRGATVAHLPHHIEQPPQHRVAHRHGHRATQRANQSAAPQPRRRRQGDGAQRRRVEMALHLDDQRPRPIPFDAQRFVDRRQRSAVESNLHHRPLQRHDAAKAGDGRRRRHRLRPKPGRRRLAAWWPGCAPDRRG